jgi:putative flippase GtrA
MNLKFILSCAKLGKFAFAGALSTIFAYFCFPIIYYFFSNTHFIVAFSLSSIANITFSYLIQRNYVFESKKKINKEYFYFLLNAFFIMLAGYFVLHLFIFYFKLNAILANFVVVTASAIFSFTVHNFITFKK